MLPLTLPHFFRIDAVEEEQVSQQEPEPQAVQSPAADPGFRLDASPVAGPSRRGLCRPRESSASSDKRWPSPSAHQCQR